VKAGEAVVFTKICYIAATFLTNATTRQNSYSSCYVTQIGNDVRIMRLILPGGSTLQWCCA